MIAKIIDFIRSFAILYSILWLAENLVAWFHMSIPSSILGLLLLFFALTTHLIKVEWIFSSASLIIRYMTILFVPVSVGIMKYVDLLLNQAKALLIPNLLSTFLTFIIVGILADYLLLRSSFSYLRRQVVKRRSRGEL